MPSGVFVVAGLDRISSAHVPMLAIDLPSNKSFTAAVASGVKFIAAISPITHLRPVLPQSAKLTNGINKKE